MELGGLHQITGRQWQLTDDPANALWPDACVVVPFGSQVKDDTATVINPVPGTSLQGGWTVISTLETLTLTDLVQNVQVAGVTAVWAAGAGGDTSALHVLGDNPFAWLTPHLDAAAGAWTTVYPELDQWFGAGPSQLFSRPRRFGELVITPVAGVPARLVAAPVPLMTTRLLQAPGARLSFSYPSGLPITVDELWLGVLLHGREKLQGDGWKVESLTPFLGGWSFAVLRIDVGAGVDAVDIPYGGSVLWVRYRHRALTVTTPARVTLQPGHYELSISGATTGTAPPGFQDAAPVLWSASQRFWVEHPASLRPYVRSSTIGDNRLFGAVAGFDPTLAGVGFPLHRDYLPVVRFCVPYVKGMFPQLRLRFTYPDALEILGDATVVPNPAGTSTLPAAALDWLTAHGGSVAPDDEVVMTGALVPGAGSLGISHVPPAGAEFSLDSWAIQISRFASAAEQLFWPGTCLTRLYRADGPHDRTPCPTLVEPPGDFPWDALHGVLRADDLHRFEYEQLVSLVLPPLELHTKVLTGLLLHPLQLPGDDLPEEYATPPGDWPLPSPLADLAGPLDAGAAQRFLLFLWRSGVQLLGDPTAPALAGVGDPIGATTIEAVCDDSDRPLALWLRTPEPLDWRRVHAELTLRHVDPAAGCPLSYAHRRALSLSVDLLPSTDGSGALLVAGLDGTPTRLPRGEITLALRYEPAEPGLVELRPGTPLPGGHETISLTFLQPFGVPWPVKPSRGDGHIHLPHVPDLVEHPPHLPPHDPGPLAQLIATLQAVEQRQ
ncbi:MAG TPA: hypothetical protein VFD90_07220 [Gaiellales bacterium]|jgi:hypothetical protein|nr:hypothetical protein [Gaiellales bacterium]